jgi:hypothetical protein
LRHRSLTLLVVLASCTTGESLSSRHGSPLYTHRCDGGKTFQSRQIISGEVEVTAGDQTRDATNADGDPVPGGPSLVYDGERTTLTGMPGGPYVNCVLEH